MIINQKKNGINALTEVKEECYKGEIKFIYLLEFVYLFLMEMEVEVAKYGKDLA